MEPLACRAMQPTWHLTLSTLAKLTSNWKVSKDECAWKTDRGAAPHRTAKVLCFTRIAEELQLIQFFIL